MKSNKLKATIRTAEGYETIDIDQLTESMDIVKIGSKHMKPYVYVREFDLSNLDSNPFTGDEMLYKHNLEPKVYKYVGVSTEQMFSYRTSKWVHINKLRNSDIGKFLNNLESYINELELDVSLNEYINQNSRVLTYTDTIEQARAYEQSLIGIVQLESDKWDLDVICLNTKDKPIEITEDGYKLKSHLQ